MTLMIHTKDEFEWVIKYIIQNDVFFMTSFILLCVIPALNILFTMGYYFLQQVTNVEVSC
jgi:hypothetical protein